MRKLFAILLLPFLLVIGSAQSQSDRPLHTTICDVAAKPAAFDGKVVRVRATLVSRFEVFAIQDPQKGCATIWLNHKDELPPTSVLLSDTSSGIRRHAVTLREDDAFKTFQKMVAAEMHPRDPISVCMDCNRFQVTATFTGRIDFAPNGGGFGHLNAYPLRFVLASVEDVVGEDLAKNYDPKDYSTEPVRFPTGHLTGTVTDPDGKPVWNIIVTVILTDGMPSLAQDYWTSTDAKGRFTIDLPPGNYIVGVNLDIPASSSFPFPSTYAPNTTEKDKAMRFALKDKQSINADINLQARLPRRIIPVKVIWPDGSVVAGANVWLVDQERPYRVVGDSVSHTDKDGKFDLIGFPGITYILRANIYLKPGYVPHCAEKHLVRPSDSITEPIVMTLTRTGNICRGSD